jgi:hypothetical protein
MSDFKIVEREFLFRVISYNKVGKMYSCNVRIKAYSKKEAKSKIDMAYNELGHEITEIKYMSNKIV